MAVKVLITRRFKEGKALELLKLLNQLRSTAINQTGYISGETLISEENPEKMCVLAVWENRENWEQWKEDPLRQNYESKMEEFLIEPTQYEVFALGALPKRK